MNKKLMAVAVVSALAAPAAALAQVTIGGGVNLLYFQHDPKNTSTSQSTDMMQSSESELAIRASEKLGGGMETWVQCATSIDGIISGNAATVAGMCTRNSAIGFRGGFGNVFFGNWDTPLKLVQNNVRGWFSGTNALYGGGFTLLAGGSSSGTVNNSPTNAASTQSWSMYRRAAQSINYQSPDWGGFTFAAAVTAGNENTAIADNASPSFSPRLYGLNGQYRLGGLWVGLGYENHTDYNPGGAALGTTASLYSGGNDTNYTIGASYTFAGRFKVTGAYSHTEYEVNNASKLKVSGYAVYGEFNVAGPHNIKVAWIQVQDTEGATTVNVGPYSGQLSSTCGPNGAGSCASSTGAKNYTIAYAYDFSKRTQGLVSYNTIDNDANARFNMGIAAATWGGKQTSWGVAIRHSF